MDNAMWRTAQLAATDNPTVDAALNEVRAAAVDAGETEVVAAVDNMLSIAPRGGRPFGANVSAVCSAYVSFNWPTGGEVDWMQVKGALSHD